MRSIRVLSSLYKYYTNAIRVECSQSPITSSVPASPSTPSAGENTANVRRTGSFGSLLDSPRNHGGRLRLRRSNGHKRSHSHGTPPQSSSNLSSAHGAQLSPSSPPPRSYTGPGGGDVTVSDPFDHLEIVWASLESWFDLLMVEVEKVQKIEVGKQTPKPAEIDTKSASATMDTITRGQRSQYQGSPVPSASSTATATDSRVTPEQQVNAAPMSELSTQKKPNLQLPVSEPSRLAAAIVHTTPLQRRVAYLRTSSSFDDSSSLSGDTTYKRRSWHFERVAARILTMGSSFTSLPSFDRSLSSDSASYDRLRGEGMGGVCVCVCMCVCWLNVDCGEEWVEYMWFQCMCMCGRWSRMCNSVGV